MASARKFNRTVRINQDTAIMVSLVRDMIETKYFPPDAERCLPDVGTIRLALDIAAASIAADEPAAKGVLTGASTTVVDEDTGQRKTVIFPSPHMSAALRGARARQPEDD